VRSAARRRADRGRPVSDEAVLAALSGVEVIDGVITVAIGWA
jgi:hypothetical protein